jgi:hypothetical protein
MCKGCKKAHPHGLVKAKGFDRSRFEILAILMRLRQICCHLDLLKDHHKPTARRAGIN